MPGDDKNARPDPRVGKELVDGLTLTRLLARGGLGSVYAAVHRARGRVAVKVFHEDIAHVVGSELGRALHQADELGSDQVPTLIELISTDAVRAAVLPLIAGESVASLVQRRKGRIPPAEALRVTCDLLEIIGAAHARGVHHGSLSPSHVLIRDDGGVHVIGFGEARIRSLLGLPLHPDFAPPDDKSNATSRDLFGVMSLCYALLLGTGPYGEPNARGSRPEVRLRRLASSSRHAPKLLSNLLDRALSHDPARRYPDAGTLLAAVRAVARDRDVEYAHPLASALAGESGSQPWLDPVRVTKPPSSPAHFGVAPTSRPPPAPPMVEMPQVSETPITSRSRVAPSEPPETEREEPLTEPPEVVMEPPEPRPRPLVELPPRSVTPPAGVAIAARSERSPASRDSAPAALPADQDALALVDEATRGKLLGTKREILALLRFDTSLQWEDAWRAARRTRHTGSAFARSREAVDSVVAPSADAMLQLRELLSSDQDTDTERLVHVLASGLEGPTLTPTLQALGPSVRQHIAAQLAHSPTRSLELLLLLQRAVRAPPAMLGAESRRVMAALAAPEVVSALYGKLGARLSENRVLDELAELLPTLGREHAAALSGTLLQIRDLSLRAKVVHHLESELTEHESDLGELARTSESALAIELVRLLARIDPLASKAALLVAGESAYPVVRIEALGASEGASGDRLRRELRARLEEAVTTERIQTLRAVADNEVKVAAPFIALRIKSDHFDGLDFEERRALFHALALLSPGRAESLAIEVLSHKKLLRTGAHEESRTLAADTLGSIGSSDEALEALRRHTERHFGTGDGVRQAARRALDHVEARRRAAARAERASHAPRASRVPPVPSEAPGDRRRR
ncbi:MAG: hypothetical protein U0263_01905 [Polyangiaceae bacterium]